MSQLFQHILDFPTAYRAFQNLISKSSFSTHKALAKYIELNFLDYKIIDIGCGDAIMASYMKEGRDYIGIDYNPEYIKLAKAKYPGFDFRVADVSEVDLGSDKVLYLLMGVVHHLSDEQVTELIEKIKAKNPSALIFCLDGVRVPKQNLIAKLLKDLDRGKFVRTIEGYSKVLKGFNFAYRSDLLLLPYDYILSAYNFDAGNLSNFITKEKN